MEGYPLKGGPVVSERYDRRGNSSEPVGDVRAPNSHEKLRSRPTRSGDAEGREEEVAAGGDHLADEEPPSPSRLRLSDTNTFQKAAPKTTCA